MSRDFNSFGTFLGTVNSSLNAKIDSPLPLDILKFVKGHGGSVSVMDIVQEVKLPITTIASSLESLKETHLIDVELNGIVENVTLTEVGDAVADFSIHQG